MKRNVLLCLAVALLITIFQPPQTIHADHQHGPTITVDQLNAVFRRVPFTSPLTSELLRSQFINIINGQFRISLQVVNTHDPKYSTYKEYYMWLVPKVRDGKIACTISQIQVEGKLFTQRDLLQPNPYFANLDGTPYCDSFLSPFLVGYGPSAVVNSVTLKNRMVMIELGGTLLPNAPHPIIVAGCSIYASWFDLNLRSGPGREYAVLTVIRNFDVGAPVLDWRGDWLKINYKGTIGWIWKYYAGQEVLCIPNYHKSSAAWLRSDAP